MRQPLNKYIFKVKRRWKKIDILICHDKFLKEGRRTWFFPQDK